MFVLVWRISAYKQGTTDNHLNIEPSRFLLLDMDVRENLEIGNNSSIVLPGRAILEELILCIGLATKAIFSCIAQ